MSISAPTSILTISIARHLVGHDVSHVLNQAWSASDVPNSTRSRFNNVGFNLAVTNESASIQDLKKILSGQHWDGFIVGWCIRSHPEFTELFETVIRTCFDYVMEERGDGHDPKIMFCSGPEDLVNATLRTFPGPWAFAEPGRLL